MPGLRASGASTPTEMENKSPRGRADGREFAEKMAIFAKYSEHQPDSACLVDMVLGFMEESEPASAAQENIMAEDQSLQDCDNEHQILQDLANAASEAERIVKDEAIRALRTGDGFPENEESKCRKRRTVMNHLRNSGYNAAVCTSRGKYAGSFPSGDYEYIDVEIARKSAMKSNGSVRLVVDIDFRAQFQIARPSAEYSAMVQLLPDVFVGRAERLQQIVRIMCISAKRSLKSSGMHLPPWRKQKYMQSKWLGPYKRDANPVLQPSGRAEPESESESAVDRNFCVEVEDDGDAAKVANSEGCGGNIYYYGAGWKPPKPCVERPRPGRVYSALANALKDSRGLSAPSQLRISQDRIPLTVF